ETVTAVIGEFQQRANVLRVVALDPAQDFLGTNHRFIQLRIALRRFGRAPVPLRLSDLRDAPMLSDESGQPIRRDALVISETQDAGVPAPIALRRLGEDQTDEGEEPILWHLALRLLVTRQAPHLLPLFVGAVPSVLI